ncbi:MAG: molybdenum cofactor biosynthesis protein MoaE [Nitrososphaerota archaeon]|nr:molybdenum cofactor biosynthesis protein MoaE [Nitrososphaerota archaeon]
MTFEVAARTLSRITRRRIVPARMVEAVADGGAGGVALFLGTVRDRGEAGPVDAIEYEAYASMAEARMAEIEEEAKRRWPTKKVRVLHRVGRLALGEVSVAVAVSCAHRAEAFEACRFIIDRIKQEVPIWKKERLAGGGERWVEGSPISAHKGIKGKGRAGRTA